MGTAVLVVVLLAGTVGVSLMSRFGGPSWHAAWLWSLLVSWIAPFAPMLCQEKALVGRNGPDDRFLTASTPTGRRALDLDALVTVRRYIVPGRLGSSLDMLIATDAHGVRLGVRGFQALDALCDALERADRRSPQAAPAAPAVSNRAYRKLHHGSRSVLWDAFVPFVLLVAWCVGVVALCATIAGV